MNKQSLEHGLLLAGLDGGNLLGFMAALGTLRILSIAWPDRQVQMVWREHAGAHRPEVRWFGPESPTSEVLGTVIVALRQFGQETWPANSGLDFDQGSFRHRLHQTLQTAPRCDRHLADRDTAMGSPIVPRERGKRDWDRTPLHCVAGQQKMFNMVRQLISQTTGLESSDRARQILASALLTPWTYSDEGNGIALRWDPFDDRRYALRWADPSGDEKRTVAGAYRLAIEGLAYFTCMTHNGRMTTVGFTGERSPRIIWPIWNTPVSADACHSLLVCPAIAQLANAENDVDRQRIRARLRLMGISAVYESRRIKPTDYASFTPAQRLA